MMLLAPGKGPSGKISIEDGEDAAHVPGRATLHLPHGTVPPWCFPPMHGRLDRHIPTYPNIISPTLSKLWLYWYLMAEHIP